MEIAEVLNTLSEESLFALLCLVQRRVRKQALSVNAGHQAVDLGALSDLLEEIEMAHSVQLYKAPTRST